MDDDNNSIHSSSTAGSRLRCHCNWKGCRSSQRVLKDHPTLGGFIRIEFMEDNESSVALKAAWDRYLEPTEEKRGWKNGTNKYAVARHHFAEAMMEKFSTQKKSWDWTIVLQNDEARKLMSELNDEDKYTMADGTSGYWKVPNVPGEEIKGIAKKWKESKEGIVEEEAPKVTKPPKKGRKLTKQLSMSDLTSTDAAIEVVPKVRKKGRGGLSKQLSVSDLAVSFSTTTKKGKKKKKKSNSLESKLLSLPPSGFVPGKGDSTDKSKGSAARPPKHGKKVSETENTKQETPGDVQVQPELEEEKAKAESALQQLIHAKKENQVLKRDIQRTMSERSLQLEAATSNVREMERVSELARDLRTQLDEEKKRNTELSASHAKVMQEIEDVHISEMEELWDREQELMTDLDKERERAAMAETVHMETVQDMESQHKLEMDRMMERQDQLREQVETLREQAHVAGSQDYALEEMEAKHTREMEELKAQLVVQVEKALAADQDADATREQVKTLEASLAQHKQEHRQEAEELLQNVNQLNHRIGNLREENARLEELNSIMENDVTQNDDSISAEERVKVLERELAKVNEMHKHEKEDQRREIETLHGRVETLEAENATLSETSASLAKPEPKEDLSEEDMSRVQELVAKIEESRQTKDVAEPSAAAPAIETLQKEKEELTADKERLSEMNHNQKKTIRALEGTLDLDNEVARKQAEKEDKLERGAALLANLYFVQENMDELQEQSADLDLRVSLPPSSEQAQADPENASQRQLLEEVISRKKKKWWGTLDGIFSYSRYIESDKKQ